ncbi:MAG: N-acetylmuramoyl-L-alanine amidase [Holosporales bacterium]|jgi:N-acetylmuramoyl-L-alanine amidase
MLVLHYTGMPSGVEALARLRDPASKVSAHYLIDDEGTIHGLVAEDRRAWHAGVGFWRGVTDINSASIGIELVNPGHTWGYRPFPSGQIEALLELLQDITQRHTIPAHHIIAHSDLAPARKQDPGELFPWKYLANKGFGLWPDDRTPPGDPNALISLLHALGYDPAADPDAVITAFCRHFAPEQLAMRDREILAGLAASLRNISSSPR